jgi:hypothetical protein
VGFDVVVSGLFHVLNLVPIYSADAGFRRHPRQPKDPREHTPRKSMLSGLILEAPAPHDLNENVKSRNVVGSRVTSGRFRVLVLLREFQRRIGDCTEAQAEQIAHIVLVKPPRLL